jgi:hypothetical protein
MAAHQGRWSKRSRSGEIDERQGATFFCAKLGSGGRQYRFEPEPGWTADPHFRKEDGDGPCRALVGGTTRAIYLEGCQPKRAVFCSRIATSRIYFETWLRKFAQAKPVLAACGLGYYIVDSRCGVAGRPSSNSSFHDRLSRGQRWKSERKFGFRVDPKAERPIPTTWLIEPARGGDQICKPCSGPASRISPRVRGRRLYHSLQSAIVSRSEAADPPPWRAESTHTQESGG